MIAWIMTVTKPIMLKDDDIKAKADDKLVIGCTIARVSSTAGLKASRRSLTGCIGAQNWCTWKTAPPESRSLHKITIAQIATAQIAGQIILGDKSPLSRSKVDALLMALIWGELDKVLAMISNLRNLWESWKLFLNHHYIWGLTWTRIQMICYPHPFWKRQNQDLSLAMGVNTLGRVEVELGGWVVKSYAGAVKKGKAITNCFDLPLTPSQTPCC